MSQPRLDGWRITRHALQCVIERRVHPEEITTALSAPEIRRTGHTPGTEYRQAGPVAVVCDPTARRIITVVLVTSPPGETLSSCLEELHSVIADLESEGHAAAGRLRNVAEHIKADFEHLVGDSETELNALATALVKTFAPELVAQGQTFLSQALEVIEPVLANSAADAKAVLTGPFRSNGAHIPVTHCRSSSG